jgi:PRC-barrel domain
MAGLTPYLIGAGVRCHDGACGQVSRVVIDPATLTVTHLVVKPDDPHQPGRLVPLDLLDLTSGEISLCCTAVEFFQLARAENTQSPPGAGDWAVFGLGRPGRRIVGRLGLAVNAPLPKTFTYDILPAGEVGLRGGDPVHALDGAIGHITGVVMDAGSRQVAYVLLHAGGPLGKNIAVPVSAVTRIDAGVQLGITKHDVRHLPPVSIQKTAG